MPTYFETGLDGFFRTILIAFFHKKTAYDMPAFSYGFRVVYQLSPSPATYVSIVFPYTKGLEEGKDLSLLVRANEREDPKRKLSDVEVRAEIAYVSASRHRIRVS